VAINNRNVTHIVITSIFLALGHYAMCMQLLTSVNQKPDVSRYAPYIFTVSNPQGLYVCMKDGWKKQVASHLIRYNPKENTIKSIVTPKGSKYSFIFAQGRASRPAAQVQPRDFGAIDRCRSTHMTGLLTDELELIRGCLVPRGAVVERDGELYWVLGAFPDEKCGLSEAEMSVLKKLWAKIAPEANPIQTNFTYENQVVACVMVPESKRSYCLLPNMFPIYPMHYLLMSTVPDKPQCIASELEFNDLLRLQSYLARQKGHMQINFNSNNAGHTMGGASLSVWHCQIADLLLGDPSAFKVQPMMVIGGVSVGTYDHLKTTHRLFMGKNHAEVSRVVFSYISVLHNANNAYNISCFKDKDFNYRVLLTIRGCWLAKSVCLTPQHNGTPAFAEVAGSLVFTNRDEYTSIVGQEPGKIEEFVENLHVACSQDADRVAQFDQCFKDLCFNQ